MRVLLQVVARAYREHPHLFRSAVLVYANWWTDSFEDPLAEDGDRIVPWFDED